MRRVRILLVVLIALTACKSSQEKSDAYLKSAITLSQNGEARGAILELKNAIKLNETNIPARKLYAQLLFEAGDISRSFREFRYVSEVYPKDLDAARAMAGIAFDSNDMENAQTYLDAAQNLDATDLGVRDIAVGVAYRLGAKDRDAQAMDHAVAEALTLVASNSDLIRARRVIIAHMLRTGRADEAIPFIDEGLRLTPTDRGLQNTKLVVLNELGRSDDIRAQILTMIALDPEDIATQRLLMDWYLSQGRLDEAQAWLKGRIDPESADASPRLTYMRFLSQLRSNTVMRDELRRVLQTDDVPNDIKENRTAFDALLAGADYVEGDTVSAMSDLETLIGRAQPDVNVDRIKMQLSVMRRETGDTVGARSLIDEVLVHDPSQLQALKEKAGWLIDDGEIDDAILVLRSALNDAPEDPQLFSLLATAYERDGKDSLVSDMLARATEASLNAPDESLRYAARLNQKGEPRLAEKVIEQALRRNSRDLRLYVSLVEIHLGVRDWPRVTRGLALMSQTFTSEAAKTAIVGLKARLLAEQNKSTELTEFLQQRADEKNSSLGAQFAIIQNLMINGNTDAARVRVDDLLRDAPDDPNVRLVHALVQYDTGALVDAAQTLEALAFDEPSFEPSWPVYAHVVEQLDGRDAALKVIENARLANPSSRALQLDYAGRLEAASRVEDAIAQYQVLYESGPDDLIVVNNLVSLLNASRQDPQSVERAFELARVLKGSNVPAFQDTFGRAAFLAGDLDSALPALEAAAKALPDIPSVVYHLGEVYAQLGRIQDARQAFQEAENLLRDGLAPDLSLRRDLTKALEALAQR